MRLDHAPAPAVTLADDRCAGRSKRPRGSSRVLASRVPRGRGGTQVLFADSRNARTRPRRGQAPDHLSDGAPGDRNCRFRRRSSAEVPERARGHSVACGALGATASERTNTAPTLAWSGPARSRLLRRARRRSDFESDASTGRARRVGSRPDNLRTLRRGAKDRAPEGRATTTRSPRVSMSIERSTAPKQTA
jgi:hypothetical protein